MKTPYINNSSLKFDPSLIVQNTGTLNGLTNKREFLFTLLNSGCFYNMINGSDKYGVNGIISYSRINAFAATQLYSTFKLLIGFYIVYYQELALVDRSTPGEGNNKYNNPWMSVYIGDPGRVGKKQASNSLLGNLQDLCQKLFDYLKYTYLQYWGSLLWTDHSDCCDWYCPGSCDRWSRMEDKSNCYDQNWWNLLNEKYPIAGMKWSAYMDNLGNSQQNRTNTYNCFLFNFNDYMNFPFDDKLKVLKRMAGIDLLVGEQNFDWGKYPYNTGYTTNNSTAYSAEGGFPYGSMKMSYKTAIDTFKYPDSYNTNDWAQWGGSYCTPLLTSEEQGGTCGNGFSHTKPFDATVFNLPGDPKTYTSSMYCNKGQSAVSCVRPGRSPGTNSGVIEPNSRTAFCVNTNDNTTSNLIQAETDVVDKCGTDQILWYFLYSPEANGNNLWVTRSYAPGMGGLNELPEFAYGGKYFMLNIDNVGTDVFDITKYITYLIESYKVNLGIDLQPISGNVLLNLSISKIPDDPGLVNDTTRPPTNLEASVSGYPIEIISATNTESNWIAVIVKIFKN